MNDWILLVLLWQSPHRMAATITHVPNEQICNTLGKKITKRNNIVRNPDSYMSRVVVRTAKYQCYENK